MNEQRELLLKATVDMLKEENKRLTNLNDLLLERFEKANKEIVKVGVSMLILGGFIGAVIGTALVRWML